MGELHIEIVHDRIRREYGIETYLGPLQVAYRESILREASATGAASRQASCTLLVYSFIKISPQLVSSPRRRHLGPHHRGQTPPGHSAALRPACGHLLSGGVLPRGFHRGVGEAAVGRGQGGGGERSAQLVPPRYRQR